MRLHLSIHQNYYTTHTVLYCIYQVRYTYIDDKARMSGTDPELYERSAHVKSISVYLSPSLHPLQRFHPKSTTHLVRFVIIILWIHPQQLQPLASIFYKFQATICPMRYRIVVIQLRIYVRALMVRGTYVGTLNPRSNIAKGVVIVNENIALSW